MRANPKQRLRLKSFRIGNVLEMAENGLPKYFEITRVRERHKLWKTAYRSVFIRRRDLDVIMQSETNVRL